MDARIRREALRAAAKVALSLTVLTGCSSTPAESRDEGTQSEEALRRRRQDPLASVDTSCPTECEAALDALTADRDANRMEDLPKSPNVVACCNTLLDESDREWSTPMDDDGGIADASEPFKTKHRFTCCRATGTKEVPWGTHVACTPWGPPMPPSMTEFLQEVA
jgi:hypothetical protein